MTREAELHPLPPPLNNGDEADPGRPSGPLAPAVTPAEPARDDLLIAGLATASVAALTMALVLWRWWVRSRRRS